MKPNGIDPQLYATSRFFNRLDYTLPTITEANSHLVLLKAFGKLCADTTGAADETERAKQWQVFVTNAVRRFIEFVSALKRLRADDVGSLDRECLRECKSLFTLNALLPPLDVLLVWHAFMLNPKSFYDNCARNGIVDFAAFPFPLMKVVAAIDPLTFEYWPDRGERDNFDKLMAPQTLSYRPKLSEVIDTKLTVYSPKCHKVLGSTLYTTQRGDGFADLEFRMACTECPCTKYLQISEISHDSLRVLQLYADTYSPYGDEGPVLPNCHRYFCKTLHPLEFSPRREVFVSNSCKKILRSRAYDWKQASLNRVVLRYLRVRRFSRILKNLLRHYLEMNIVHATIEGSVLVSEDLVACVLRQQRFVNKMNEIDLLHSPAINAAMQESATRYRRFFSMLTMRQPLDKPIMMVPTLDIDLYWHTHQLAFCSYLQHCLAAEAHVFVDHNDRVEQGRLSANFDRTAKLYRDMFDDEYSLCFCWYCTAARNRPARPTTLMDKLFKKKKRLVPQFESSALLHDASEAGMTHISDHNVIHWPGTIGLRNRRQLRKAIPPPSTYHKYPWDDYAAQLFVAPLLLPIGEAHARYWGPGACVSTRLEGNGGGCSGAGCGDGKCGAMGPGGGAPCGSLLGRCDGTYDPSSACAGDDNPSKMNPSELTIAAGCGGPAGKEVDAACVGSIEEYTRYSSNSACGGSF